MRDGGTEGWMVGGREGWREGGVEGGREGGREGLMGVIEESMHKLFLLGILQKSNLLV